MPGQGGEELNRGLGATSEEMVGGRRIGEDQGLESSERGEEGEDEDADEDADQENEEEEVTEQEEEEEGGGGGRTSGGTRRGVAGDSVARGDRGLSPPPSVVARSGGRVKPPLLASRGSYEFCDTQ